MTTVKGFADLLPAQRPAVVTGASAGIGAATARLLASSGHPVVLGARRLDTIERIAAEITASGGKAFAAGLDLTDEGSVAEFAIQAAELAGPIEVLVSNAGLVQPGDALTADRELFDRHLEINLHGTRALAQALGAGMVERQRGDLIFVTSEVLTAPRPHLAAYVTSKFAAEGMVTALSIELDGTGVRVSRVRPGPTLTEMGWDWDPEVLGPLYAEWERSGVQPHPNFMSPEDVAVAIAAVVGAPPGVLFRVLEVGPMAPITPLAEGDPS